jgi:hypothetical protein
MNSCSSTGSRDFFIGSHVQDTVATSSSKAECYSLRMQIGDRHETSISPSTRSPVNSQRFTRSRTRSSRWPPRTALNSTRTQPQSKRSVNTRRIRAFEPRWSERCQQPRSDSTSTSILVTPFWPEPKEIELPRLLGSPPLRVRGYSVELILAEKIVTAIQRGTANTRWRDFVDIASLGPP